MAKSNDFKHAFAESETVESANASAAVGFLEAVKKSSTTFLVISCKVGNICSETSMVQASSRAG